MLQKTMSHPSLVIHFFAIPPIKLKLRQQTVGGLQIANHLDQSKMQIISQIMFITLFSAGAQHCCAFYQQPWVSVQLC
jgi:hypothetical protein